jgi:hypothetical protein
MSETINLPSGNTVVIRDVTTIKQGDRRKVYAHINAENGDTFASGMRLVDAVLTVMIESWSFEMLPPSVKVESLDELTLGDYDLLQDLATNYMKGLFPALGKTVETDADPKAPTDDSNALSGF